jgi:pyruvate formate-lyase activating enzyme-like uncharacterized protein
MCQEGSKMVLLVTGHCTHDCFYCPLSLEKQGKAVTYANEKKVETDDDVLYEAGSIDARGTGITGGDPLLDMEKTIHYIRLLKENFGGKHNIHLYTSTTDAGKITELAEAGLDEIRFHPPIHVWGNIGQTEYVASIRQAREVGLRTGLEIPAIPGYEAEILKLASDVGSYGAQFMNLNELEFSESNWQELKKRDYEVRDDISSAVLGSEATAHKVADDFPENMTLHYCSSSFKDATQLRKRIMRRAKNVSTPLDVITEDGTFVRGVIECQSPKKTVIDIIKRFEIPTELIRFDGEKNRVEIAAWILEKIYRDVEGRSFIVEEYPTADRLEVERRPLDK